MPKRFIVVLGLVVWALPVQGELRKWNQKMQELGKALTETLPIVVTDQPMTKSQEKALKKTIGKMVDLAHTINFGPDAKGGSPLPPEADATLKFVSGLFERQVKSAHRAANSGQMEYARAAMRKVAGYCVSCHTRHDMGPDFPTFQLEPKVAGLDPVEKGQLLVALRQFDGALDEFERAAADDSLAKRRPFDWEKAVRQGLNVAVRVKQDVGRAESLLKKVRQVKHVPGFLREDMEEWQRSLDYWKLEKGKRPDNANALYKEALDLSTAARMKQQFPLDHAADVLYLRASAAVHELLVRFPDSPKVPEALLLAGNAYRLLGDPLVSPLSEMYYEACIRSSPHTELAGSCYRRYEESVYFGFTGSGGTFLPEDVRALLDELEKLAAEKPKGKE